MDQNFAGDPLKADDQALIETAKGLIERRYQENRHHIASAVRGASGRVYTGLHLDTYVGRASVCAEAVALGQAMAGGETGIEAIVSVRHPRPRERHQDCKVVSPCGICREMLTDFAKGAVVILLQDGVHLRVPVEELLPAKYRRHP
ncbi:MAG: cytidine deaminase [Dongiaceae bacterium]